MTAPGVSSFPSTVTGRREKYTPSSNFTSSNFTSSNFTPSLVATSSAKTEINQLRHRARNSCASTRYRWHNLEQRHTSSKAAVAKVVAFSISAHMRVREGESSSCCWHKNSATQAAARRGERGFTSSGGFELDCVSGIPGSSNSSNLIG